MTRCNPTRCPYCTYIGEGDSVCDVLQEIVLRDWLPTAHFMGVGCPFRRTRRRHQRRKR